MTIHPAPAQILVSHSAHMESASNTIVPDVCWAQQARRDPGGHSAVLLDCSTSFPAAVKVWLLCKVTAWNFLQNPLNSENFTDSTFQLGCITHQLIQEALKVFVLVQPFQTYGFFYSNTKRTTKTTTDSTTSPYITSFSIPTFFCQVKLQTLKLNQHFN